MNSTLLSHTLRCLAINKHNNFSLLGELGELFFLRDFNEPRAPVKEKQGFTFFTETDLLTLRLSFARHL